MKDRRIEIDICKCICILGMIIVHSFETFSMFAAASTTAQYIILNILNTIFGAGSFMFCMGMSLNYSRHNSSRDLIIRGLKIFALGYLLNLLRSLVILVVLQDVVTFVMDLFDPDILQFAGLALILFGILKKFIKNDYVILAIAITLSVISTLLPFYNFEGWILDDIVGLFVCSVDPEYFVGGPFPLISWFIFIPSGYIFAKEIKNNNATYKKALFASLIIICNYLLIAIPNKIGMMNSSKYFYKLGILDSLVCIAGAIFALSIYYLISKNINEKLRLIITNISSRITYIYFIQWVLIVLMYTLSLKLNLNIVSDIQMFLLGVLNIILSISLSFIKKFEITQ